MRGFITITPASPSKVNNQRIVSVNTAYIVSIGKVDENTAFVTTTQDHIIVRESYDEVVELLAVSQKKLIV